MFKIASFHFLLIACHLIPSCYGALSLDLKPQEEVCISFKTLGDQPGHITGSYDLLDDELSAKPVSVVLFDYDSEEVKWHSDYEGSEGSFSLTTAGKFHLCFGNGAGGYKTPADKENEKRGIKTMTVYDYTNTDGINRRIGFSIRIKPVVGTKAFNAQLEKNGGENEASLQSSKLVDLTLQLADRMELLLDHQEYIKNREMTHRNIVESTFTMIMKWTFLEAIVLIVVACAQVFYLKKFFETKRYL